MGDRYRVERVLPLKPAVFGILLALAEEPGHGYGLLGRVREQSDGAIDLGTGQLYRLLRRLLDDGWVDEIDPPDDADREDPRRRYYRLTDRGILVLEAEARRLANVVKRSRGLGLLVEDWR